jgi:osmotically-inducible protein OsmY
MMNRKHTLAIIVSSTLLASGAAAAAGPQIEAWSPQNEVPVPQTADANQSVIRDAWLDGKLETALLFNSRLNSFDIDTDVKTGVASLSGAVESEIDRQLAGDIAESINGITEVQNNLVVDKTKASEINSSDASKERGDFRQAVLNATLTARVKSELLLNSETSGLAIDVDSKDGVVTLSGEVKSAEEKALAARIAGNADGAKSVLNHLTVASPA